MQHFHKQCTNGTYNPDFGLKNGVNTPWQVYFAEYKKKNEKVAAEADVSRFLGYFQGKTLDT